MNMYMAGDFLVRDVVVFILPVRLSKRVLRTLQCLKKCPIQGLKRESRMWDGAGSVAINYSPLVESETIVQIVWMFIWGY